MRKTALILVTIIFSSISLWAMDIDIDFHRLYKMNKAENLFKKQKFTEASAAYIKLAENAPDNSEKLMQLAKSAIALGKTKDSFEKAMGNAKNIPDEYYTKYAEIEILFANKKYNEVITTFKDENISSWPEQIRHLGFNILGKSYEENKNYEAAVNIYLDCAKHADIDPEVKFSSYYSAVISYIKLGKNNEALSLIEKAVADYDRIGEKLKYGRLYADFLRMGADILVKKERYEYALALLAKYDKGNWVRHLWCLQLSGDILVKLNRKTEALKKYREALEIGSGKSSHHNAVRERIAKLIASGLNEPVMAGTEGLKLVEGGKSLVPVILFKDAPPYTLEAAERLVEYIEKTSGAKPELIKGTPETIPENAIWVGYQKALDDLFPEIDFNFQNPEEILISANENHLVIAGRDIWDPENFVIKGRRGTITGSQLEYGTVNAAYTFLQECLGVRWLYPDERGEDVLEMKTIAFKPFTYRYYPQIRSRRGIFRLSADGDRRGVSFEWTRLQRLQLDSLFAPGGHSYGDWFERFHETHPEYFALQPDGTRSGFPRPHCAKLCLSNPAVWDQWLKDVEKQIEEHPNRTVFNCSPNDSALSGHCICENCRAWDHPEGEMCPYSWNGLGMEYVAMSERQVILANHLAEKLKNRFPDKDYYVLLMAYGNSRPAPVKAIAADNVIISNVANMLTNLENVSRHSRNGKGYAQQFAEWSKYCKHQFWRPNTGSPAGWHQGMPDIPLARIAESIKFAAANNCTGIFIDTVWEHWATRAPMYYLMAKLAWNPDEDPKEILEDFCKRSYGKGAEELKAYWLLVEQTRNLKVDKGIPYYEAFNKVFFDQAYWLIEKGTEKSSTGPERYLKRIATVRAGLDFIKNYVGIVKLMDEYKTAEGERKNIIAKEVNAKWEVIKKICKDKRIVRFNWIRGKEKLMPEKMDKVKEKKLEAGLDRNLKVK